VWTGPDARGSAARDTSVVVAELFARARQTVLIAGYSFDDTQDILAPLHAAMRDRQVEASVFVDLTKLSAPAESELADPAETAAKLFLERWWPFGDPKPAIFYDPRTAEPRSLVSLHAKCVVVDDRTTLITSANFTRRGHDRNLELGALIEDPGYARAVVGHWRGLVSHGVFQRLVLRSSP
jgi:phosphatidylserine/phosphatidylglycerophosphate/cardiolipin synthase-like enzyme